MCLIFIYISIPTCCSYESCLCFIMTLFRLVDCFITNYFINSFNTIAKIFTIWKMNCIIVFINMTCYLNSAYVANCRTMTFNDWSLPSVTFFINYPNFFGFVLCIVPSFALVWVFCCRLCSRCRCRLT